MPIAPNTFYAARTRPPSARAVRDEDLKPVIERVHQENYGVYGIRKVHAALNREQVLAGSAPVARCTTQRLMKDLGLRGISRAKGPRTTVSGTSPDTRPDLVNPHLHRRPPRSPVGRRHHPRPHLRRLGLLRLRPGRLQPPRRGLAGLHLAAHRPGPGRPQHGPVDPPPRRPRHQHPGAPLRPRRSRRMSTVHSEGSRPPVRPARAERSVLALSGGASSSRRGILRGCCCAARREGAFDGHVWIEDVRYEMWQNRRACRWLISPQWNAACPNPHQRYWRRCAVRLGSRSPSFFRLRSISSVPLSTRRCSS